MNKLTAIRTFAAPGFCPVKRTRIFANRWYKVTMQNTERDMGDGYYLAEGEYVELIPGNEARRRRDARLNHCNRIEEWTGPVYALFTTYYGSWNGSRQPEYFGDLESLEKAVKKAYGDHLQWISKVNAELNKKRELYAQKPQEWLAGSIQDCERCIRERSDTFGYHIEKER